jgi:predicted nuclease of predicted toxin-antitoxin system
MTQSKILVDSNAYFRLARDIHPLLGKPFGQKKYCLYIIEGFEREYLHSGRLQTKFHWVAEAKYSENRQKKITLSRAEKNKLNETKDFFKDAAVSMDLTTGAVDIEALAIAYILKVPIVTDDGDMIILANEFEVTVIKVLEIMKVMLQEKVIDLGKIRAIVAYWKYISDLPKNCDADYERIFGEKSPSKETSEGSKR